ncbi:hypothetical protein GCM10011289_23780 [Paludibacterium paludis]|uniref:Uncharacterized protein n=2 Tax=Paludibacterium paludis TaxID=1225769 RepID=A0A918P4M5_9NEIS|nr:hypothetical protein GCM10011289_23780 [Paludibacterium paludis]
MEEVGLVPSSTGQPGGKKTGQKMADYPASGGKFLLACVELVKDGFCLSWIDRGFNGGKVSRSSVSGVLDIEDMLGDKLFAPIGKYFTDFHLNENADVVLKKRKVKYFCSSCQANVWGKKGLQIMCMKCNKLFVVYE